jgi:hypothetical protein
LADYKVQQYLREIGYQYVNVGSWWGPTRSNKNAAKNYVFTLSNYLNLDEFSTKLLSTTVLSPFIQKSASSQLDEPFGNYDHRNRILYGFESLKKIPGTDPSPKFILGHLLMPHGPYVLGKNCEPLTPADTKKIRAQENYLNQLACGNKHIKEVVASILKKSKNTIIVLQADEGPHPIRYKFTPNWNDSKNSAIREKTGILNAYYFPDQNYKALYQTITPVNTFRTIFNQYFGGKFEKLADTIYIFENPQKPYHFYNATERVK